MLENKTDRGGRPMGMKDWVNVHTHKPGTGICVVDPCLGESLLSGERGVYYSLGIHPCYIGADSGKRLELIDEAAMAANIVAVGEAGLDRHSTTPMNEQFVWFERQADIALRYGLPLVIHVVRAIPELIGIRKNFPKAPAWIVHGFNNRKETLAALLEHDFYVSAGKQLMNNRSNIATLLPDIPIDRLFLETDDSDECIENIYKKAAEVRRMKVEVLQNEVMRNFERTFLIKRESCPD